MATTAGAHYEIKNFNELETRQFKPDADGHLFLITPAEIRELARDVALGTPFITGESGFRILRPIPLPYYRLELLSQKLVENIRARICTAMMMILR